jgi:hypothetical protein
VECAGRAFIGELSKMMRVLHGKSGASWSVTLGLLALCFVLSALLPGVASADQPYPGQGVRVVDGNIDDWNLTKDFYDYMYCNGKPGNTVECWLYLRYDCDTSTLWILVRAKPNVKIFARPRRTAWVIVGCFFGGLVNGASGNNGTPPDFAWIGLTETPDGKFAEGFEASVKLNPGRHTLIAHAFVMDKGGIRSAATSWCPKIGVPVYVDCAVPVEEKTWGAVKSIYR